MNIIYIFDFMNHKLHNITLYFRFSSKYIFRNMELRDWALKRVVALAEWDGGPRRRI